jgi:AcrR family transcriptional regulator
VFLSGRGSGIVPGVARATPIDEGSLAYREGTGAAAPRVRRSPGDAFVLARDWVRAGRQLDMVALAAELGISRGTLYRWTGDRDQLLADVVWADLELMIDVSLAGARGPGVRRLQSTFGRFLELVNDQSAVRALLANEGEPGLRMLIAPRGRIRPRLVARTAAIIAEEAGAGRYRPPAPPDVLADGVVSLGERFLHNGGDPGLNPDLATAKTIVGLLLREPPSRARAN